ncbi:hypothetical protein ARMSODRAFT_469679 [Armillaria solidipes]|uniref:Uncharacterized protein n=1 Tax=Armillaria solidipes TaxID=1076256 RepID=A0A2H3B5Y7_9AGAR|nr:hypothetical protein ARMSODRAFT_469679 [Armillaria solidipes]
MTSESTLCSSPIQTIGSFYGEESDPHPHSPESNLTSSVSQSATKDPEKTTATTTVFSTTTQSLGTESPPSSSVSSTTTTPTSSHTLLILGSVLGVIAFISSLLFLLFLFLRRRKKRRNNADRESQIPEPYCQEKVPPSQTSQGQDQDQGEVLRDRARIGDLEETLRLLLNNQHQHSIMGSEIDPQPPPDYASASSSADGPFRVSGIP